MSKTEKNSQNLELVKNTSELPMLNYDNIDFESGFEQLADDFLTPEFLEENKGVEFKAIIKDLISKEIKGKEVEFAEMDILATNGSVKVLAGQFKFIQAFKEKNKGNGIAVVWVFRGIKKLDNGRTMNDFLMAVKSL